ncbi:MAG: polysaccharide deacetylase family protein [Bacteroidota bacterium]|nr:polysaccharide deacetylase family protein [Bacteroidota bacterium]
MIHRKCLQALLMLLLSTQWMVAQDSPWYGNKKAAVVLTYDDAIDQHLDNALPVLDSLGFKASFYITAFSPSMQQRMNEWKALPKRGHELGNHTLYHPCIGGAGREWVSPDYDMSKYTLRRMLDEIRMTNLFLQALDGRKERTFAFTCGDMTIADSPFIQHLSKDFIAARAVRAAMHPINEVDLYNVDCYVVNGQTAAQLMEWVDKAIATKSLLVLLFHGVGGGNALNIEAGEHRRFLQLLKEKTKQVWVSPLAEVAKYIKQYQDHQH